MRRWRDWIEVRGKIMISRSSSVVKEKGLHFRKGETKKNF